MIYLITCDDGSLSARLTCMRWTDPMSAASSAFDFPDEALWCDECEQERQLDLQLQLAILGRI